jgi:hypothetical protein
VKLLSLDAEEPSVLDAFLKEVALCACLRGSSRVVRLLGACLGGAAPHQQQQQQPQHAATVSSASTAAEVDLAAAAAESGQAGVVRRCTSSQCSAGSGQGDNGEPGTCYTTAGNGAAGSSTGRGQQQQQQQLALIMELVQGGNLAQRIYHPSKRRLSYLEVGEGAELQGCACACCTA